MPDNRVLKKLLFGTLEGHDYRGQLRKCSVDRRYTEVVQHDITTGVTSRAGLCKVEDFHSWPLRFLNHKSLTGCLHDPANVQTNFQQTSSKRPALARVFWIHLLDVCWIV